MDFDNEIDTIVGTFTNGDVVTVHDFDGYPMGKGFINQNSKIRIRMLTRHADQEINENFSSYACKECLGIPEDNGGYIFLPYYFR